MSKRMLVLCPFPQGVAAGQRLKYEQYFDDWRAQGYDITVSSFMDMAMWKIVYEPGNTLGKVFGVLRGHLRRCCDLFRIWRYDVVYVFMYVTPVGTSVFERLVRLMGKRVIYDIEDNILAGQTDTGEQTPNPIMRLLKGPGKARYLIRTADHVIASSPFLSDYCLQEGGARAATYISSSIDTDRFQPATPYSNDKPVVIGWTGTFSSSPFLDLLRPVFAELAKRVDFKLHVIGNFDYELPGVDLKVIRWSAEKEVADLQEFDIGVYPLPINDWVLGKSGLKAIQYMAFALPAVCSNVGTTPQLIRDRENGMLVTTEDDWVNALEELVCNPDLRRKLGQAARADAVDKYSTHAIAAEYRAVLENVMGSK